MVTRAARAAEIAELRSDPVAFCARLLRNPDGTPFVPHAAQQAILHGIKRNTAIVTGRQFGKSVGIAAYIAYWATTHADRQVYIIGPSLDQARIIFDEVARQFRKPNPLASLVHGNVREFPFPLIKLKNGTQIHGRGANSPKYIRGHHAHLLVLDEASFFKDGIIADAIEPMMTVSGGTEDAALIQTSTPFGNGEFYEFCESCKGDGAYFQYTSYDNPHADVKFLERQKARYGEDSLRWRTEYLGQFADSDLAVFPWADIKWAYDHYGDAEFPLPAARGHAYVQGVDLANRSDFFVATVLDVTDPLQARLVRMDRHQRRTYGIYKDIIRANFAAYHSAETLVDATTLAESVVEDLSDIGANGYVFGGSRAKMEVVQELARMLSEHRLLVPYDRTIIDELRYFEYDITPAKNVRLEARRGHDDIVISLALCAHQAAVPRELGTFQAVNIDGPRSDAMFRVKGDPIAAWFAGEDEEWEPA